MQAWKKFVGKLATMVSTINLNTDKWVGGGNRHNESSNRNHFYDYESNGYGVPTLKSIASSYSTIFGRHPPMSFGPQPLNRQSTNA